MRPRSHRRQMVLFLVAIIVPCSVLVALSLRMISQERELAEKRLADERQRLRSQAGQKLLALLERIKLEEASVLALASDKVRPAKYQHPAIRLVARVENNRLVLPWERTRSAEQLRKFLGQAEFARKIQQGEREELVAKQFEKAGQSYRESVDLALHPAQTAHAQLLLARVLAKSGRRDEALARYRKILQLPSDVIDEHGVPVAFYAAGRLLEAGAEHKAALERVRHELDPPGGLAPVESYMLRELAEKLGATAPEDLKRKILGHIRYLEQALALQKDFPRLAATNRTRSQEPIWVPYGEETWLVGVAPPLGGLEAAVVAVRAEQVMPGEIRILTGRDSNGELLGENFPGLKVALRTEDDSALARQRNLQRYFYFAALALVVSLTLFGAYLLLRDVRRELRLAELRSQFVSSVSHELKTPLTAIRMFAETLWLGRSKDQQMQAEYLETIVNESERLTRLVDNVLDFSKIEQGKKTYRVEPASLAEIVHAAARAVRYPLAQQGFELRVDAQDGLPPLRVDRDALEQAILNLLTNAMKYSGDARQIDLRLQREDGEAVIQVSDRGVGIAAEEQARIFDKFYRAPTRENQLVPGTGLGLTLVAHIAKAHGGQVEVKSAPGEGSTFSIRLPLEVEA